MVTEYSVFPCRSKTHYCTRITVMFRDMVTASGIWTRNHCEPSKAPASVASLLLARSHLHLVLQHIIGSFVGDICKHLSTGGTIANRIIDLSLG